MRIFRILACLFAVASCAEALAFWPFGSDETKDEEPKRVSELLEKASELIDTASDMAATGAVQAAISTYRKALVELKTVEEAEPERAKTPEFSTLRNKRAYVEAAITSLQWEETRRNVKSVTVTDTAELERKRAAERDPKGAKKTERTSVKKTDSASPKKAEKSENTRDRARQKTLELLAAGRLEDADRLSLTLYGRNTNDVMALNLRAAVLAASGRASEGMPLLDRAIALAPDDYVAYYNMARLLMQLSPDNKETARGYFADGCALGGPKNAKLEALLR